MRIRYVENNNNLVSREFETQDGKLLHIVISPATLEFRIMEGETMVSGGKSRTRHEMLKEARNSLLAQGVLTEKESRKAGNIRVKFEPENN